MSSRFPALTTEIIELIAIHLDPADLRSLRLVCRQLNEKSLHSYGLANFATVKSDLSRDSLKRLNDISELEHLATHVQCLHIDVADGGANLGEGFHWPRHPSGALIERTQGGSVLRDILPKRLPKCLSFHICSYDEYRLRSDPDIIIPSDVVGLIQDIIATIPLKSFKIQSNHTYGRLDTARLRIHLSHEAAFVNSWAHVEELVLEHGILPDQFDWILYLISSTTKLRLLSLGFSNGDATFMQQLNSLHTLSRIEELSLRLANVTEESIMALLLDNRETLHSLSLQSVELEEDDGKWATVLAKMKGQLPWLRYISLYWLTQLGLGDKRNRLETFTGMERYPQVHGSEEGEPGVDHYMYDSHRIDSVTQPLRLRYFSAKRKVVGVEYHGDEMDTVLAALTDSLGTM